MDSLGARLAHTRKDQGLTLHQLAERTGLKLQNISRIEQGHRTHVRSDTLQRLADALDVSADFLLQRTDDPAPPPKRPRPRTAAPVG
jgi:transcriptional regulator with XRE-family HTH domain